jgi:hypothetical protein
MEVNTGLQGRSGMTEEKQVLHSERVQAGRVVYFIDVREAANGSVYMSLTQCRHTPSEGQERSDRVYVFEDCFVSFRKALSGALRAMQKEVAARREGDIAQLRNTFPRAFEKWTPEEEDGLRSLFAVHGTPAAIAPHTGRTERAVSLRLQKLGLIPAEPAGSGGAPAEQHIPASASHDKRKVAV